MNATTTPSHGHCLSVQYRDAVAVLNPDLSATKPHFFSAQNYAHKSFFKRVPSQLLHSTETLPSSEFFNQLSGAPFSLTTASALYPHMLQASRRLHLPTLKPSHNDVCNRKSFSSIDTLPAHNPIRPSCRDVPCAQLRRFFSSSLLQFIDLSENPRFLS